MSPVIDNDVALVEEDGEEAEEQDEGSSTDAEGEMVERWRGLSWLLNTAGMASVL